MIQSVRYIDGKKEKRSSPPEYARFMLKKICRVEERSRGGGGELLRNEKDFQYDANPL